MSVLNSSSCHGGESLTTQEPGPENLDSDPGHLSEEDPEETFAQNPEVLSLGLPGLDTNPANWPGLRTLLQQLPPQDSSERYCLAVGEEELAELRLFCAQRRREALGQGVARLVPPKLGECTCEKCREQMRPGEYGVFAARAGEQRCWHRACFACQACGQALINLIYFYHNGHLYCGRHHAELLRPRCPACDQLIFSPRCTEAEGRRWHENHFCCQDCAGPLGGGRYALPGGGPCCPSCFESRYLNAGLSPAPAMEGRVSLAAPRIPTAPPTPESRGPQLSPRVPGRSAPRASRTHPAPQPQPRRGTRLLYWERGRPLVGGGGEGRGALERNRRRGGAHGLGAGQEPGSGFSWPPRRDVGKRLGALRACLTHPGAGESGLDRVEGRDRVPLHALTISEAALLNAATASSSPETQRGLHGSSLEQESRAGDKAEAPKGREQGSLETPLDPKEDVPCPTCSSSSDSEPEGFFLGQRLPRPCKTPGILQAGDSNNPRKHCTIC